MKRIGIFTLIFIIIATFSDAASFNRLIYPVKTKDASGYELKQQQAPQRIISGSAAITEILFALNLENKVVGVTDDSNYPEAAKKAEKVGREKLSINKVLNLRPDLVIIPLPADKGYLDGLRKLAFNIEVSGEMRQITLEVFTVDPKSISDVFAMINTIGTITNKEHSAYSLLQRTKRSIEWVTARAMKEKRIKALMLTSKRPITVAGDGTYLGDMLKAAGFINAAPKGDLFSKMTRDQIQKADPDIVITNTSVASDPKDIYNNRSFRKTGAGKTKRAVCIDKEIMLRPGPRLADAIEAIAKSAYGWGSEIEQTKD